MWHTKLRNVVLCKLPIVYSRFQEKRNTFNDGEENYFALNPSSFMGRDGTVGIATRYGLEGTGIESQWARGFPTLGPPGHL